MDESPGLAALVFAHSTFTLMKTARVLRLSRRTAGLIRGSDVYLTSGECDRATTSFVMSGAPRPAEGRPDLGGSYGSGKRCFEYPIRRGSVNDIDLPIRIKRGAERLWIAGEIAIAVRTTDGLTVVSNRLDGGVRRAHSWRPWSDADTRLQQLEGLVAARERPPIFAWFRRKSSLPTPTYATRDALTGRLTTEIDHLVPVRVLVDRLLEGSLKVDRLPQVLLTINCSTSEHRFLSSVESSDHLAIMRGCRHQDLVDVALHRYGTYGLELFTPEGIPIRGWETRARAAVTTYAGRPGRSSRR